MLLSVVSLRHKSESGLTRLPTIVCLLFTRVLNKFKVNDDFAVQYRFIFYNRSHLRTAHWSYALFN